MSNPFRIDIVEKEDYTLEEWQDIQNRLRAKIPEIEQWVHEHTPNDFVPLEFILNRCLNGVRQTLIDGSRMPLKQLFQIGHGGNRKHCFVCSTPFQNNRYDNSQTMKESLEKVHYNGHFLLWNGGFPNPTGKEVQYAGVPYCFKIFMMLEARKLGFEQIIWLDSACLALQSPDRLFELLETDHVLFRTFPSNYFEQNTYRFYVFPHTLDLLTQKVGRYICQDVNINSIVFGLDFTAPIIQQFVDEYYQMVEWGWPFLSYFPEEFVFATLFNSPTFSFLLKTREEHEKLYIHEQHCDPEIARQYGFFFLQRHH